MITHPRHPPKFFPQLSHGYTWHSAQQPSSQKSQSTIKLVQTFFSQSLHCTITQQLSLHDASPHHKGKFFFFNSLLFLCAFFIRSVANRKILVTSSSEPPDDNNLSASVVRTSTFAEKLIGESSVDAFLLFFDIFYGQMERKGISTRTSRERSQ